MMAPLQRLIESLRHELQQYGEMLALLEQQQRSVRFQGASDALQACAAIRAHQGVLTRARQIRREANASMARALGQLDSLQGNELIPLLPREVRPLIAALIEENGALQGEVHEKAQRNQRLLRQSADLMEDFIRALDQNDTQWLGRPTRSQGTDLYEAIA